MTRLAGKVAIITGGARGMGEAHARRFVAEGAKVAITDLNEEQGQALANELGENVIFIKQDVSSEADWKNVIAKTEEAFGSINVLVNNAGISINNSIEAMPLDQYMKIVNINQVSVFLGMKYVIESMKKAGIGSIVNVSSINGLVAGAIGYTDTKFAVRGMTKAAAMEFSRYNVRVNSVHPGVIETPMIKQGDSEAQIREYAKFIPLKRIAKPEEVTNLVLFLASDESSYSTASEFVVDGGISAQ